MPSNFTAISYGFVTGCHKLYFSSAGCRNTKKFGKHWFSLTQLLRFTLFITPILPSMLLAYDYLQLKEKREHFKTLQQREIFGKWWSSTEFPNLSLTKYPFRILTDQHVLLHFLWQKCWENKKHWTFNSIFRFLKYEWRFCFNVWKLICCLKGICINMWKFWK